MSTYYPPYKSSSQNIKVELDLANYATKDDVKNITYVDVSSFASKTNLAALKTEVDKIDADKLKTVPVDLAKLSNVVNNDIVKKTDYNTKVTSIESQIAGGTKNTLDNLGDVTKLKAVDTSNFVLKTKFASDVTTSENKIDTVDKKIPDISGLATKTSLTSYLQTATFNSSEFRFFLAPSSALTIASPALIIPFPSNKLPNKLTPSVPSNILKNPPLCSLVSF